VIYHHLPYEHPSLVAKSTIFKSNFNPHPRSCPGSRAGGTSKVLGGAAEQSTMAAEKSPN